MFSNKSGEKSVLQIQIHTTGTATDSFKILQEDKSFKFFNSIEDIVKHYARFLKTPLLESILEEEWFFGDLSSEGVFLVFLAFLTFKTIESEEYLAQKCQSTPGYFLVRFGRRSLLASSYITHSGQVSHSSIFFVEGKYQSGTRPNIVVGQLY